MADKLTQLQDCLDDLLTQMYASISYIRQRHPYGEIPGQPSQAPKAPEPTTNGAGSTEQTNGTVTTTSQPQQPAPGREGTPPPEEPQAFNAALHELARDLVIKEQQIEYLINSLPGLGSSEADQEKRMRELQVELREVEAERAKAEVEKEALVEGLGKMIVGIKRVP
ncbi:RNA polymerase II mediator complex subunit [Saxophila tyrrhenica]|uniref:Mediator of RNA polymerase II transcription subunit 21 n=1 Tax=Saxophila tyrrhenica TaxID=1690608 RepID=A0AAV9PN59_9PEZI|nr:RNA polymerase II mediator complex subunit [Saxophila tyrrhenica]